MQDRSRGHQHQGAAQALPLGEGQAWNPHTQALVRAGPEWPRAQKSGRTNCIAGDGQDAPCLPLERPGIHQSN